MRGVSPIFTWVGMIALACLLIFQPASSASAAPPLEVYGRLPAFENAALSSSGKRVALISVIDGKRQLILLDEQRKPFKAILLDQNAKIRGLNWAGDDLVLITLSNTADLGLSFTAARAELWSMIVVPLDADEAWSVLKDRRDITGGIWGFHGLAEKGGKWFGYFGAMTMDQYSRTEFILTNTNPVLYEVDLQTKSASKIANRITEQTDNRTWLVDASGQVAVTLDYFGSQGSWTIRNASWQPLAKGNDPLGNIDLISLGSAGDTVIYRENDAEGEPHWFEVPLAGNAEPKEVFADTGFSSAIIDPRTRRLIGYELSGDQPRYHFFNPFHQKVIDAVQKAFPGLGMELIDWNDRFDQLIVRTEGVGDPTSWQIVDVRSGKADQLGVSYPMASSDVAPMKMVRYKAGDGLDIEAVLTLPPGREAKKLPVIIFPHGGPAARDYPGFDWWAQAFASRGYAVLQPNFRGSTGYGAAFLHAGYGEWGRKMQTDLSDGLAWLTQQGIADPRRACIMGGSYGGYAALAGVTLQQGLYRCSVAVAGVSDLVDMTQTDIRESGGDPTLRRALKEELGSGRDLRAVSPVNFAERADAPVLLIHGKDDVVVLYRQSQKMADALKRAGKPVEFVTLPGEDHWLSRSETRLAMLKAAMAFMEKHNPPDSAR